MPPPILAITGRLRAERATWRAIRRVPAYRDYLERNRIDPDGLPPAAILRAVPETDKASYIDPYPMDQRCVDGRIAFKGVTIDESSGSTGTPYNWIRGAAERSVAQRNIAFFARYAFGAGDLVTLNAFSMGAWATGFNMSLGMNRHGLVKSIGPDIPKILSSLTAIGPSHRYLISGYPPFIKHLLDEGDRQGFPWSDYRMCALVGGEGMAEELRDRLLERFEVVYSGYGATDLEIGMAGESPVSVALRRLARARPDIRAALFGTDPRLPMVFQYNPLVHFLEVNALGEVLCTVSRLDLMTPRIRYNVHDSGGLLDFATARRVLSEAGIDIARLGALPEVAGPRGPLPWSSPIPLPFVYVYGRRDATISVMGANIYPEDIETIVYGDPGLSRAAPVVPADHRDRRDRHASAGDRAGAGGERDGRRRLGVGALGHVPRRPPRPQRRLPRGARRVPGGDAAGGHDPRPRWRAVRGGRGSDQAEAPAASGLTAIGHLRGIPILVDPVVTQSRAVVSTL